MVHQALVGQLEEHLAVVCRGTGHDIVLSGMSRVVDQGSRAAVPLSCAP
jgi:hypothetical protein